MPLPAKPFSLTIASGVSLSTSLDLGYGWGKINVAIPTMASGSGINFFAAESLTGTYRQIFHAPTVTSAPVAYSILSSVTNCMIPLQVTPQFVKIQLPTATTDTSYTFYFVCTE